MRQTIKEIEVNVAYRWFIGYSLTEPVPHFSTFGKNYVWRFAAVDILKACANKHKSKEVKVTKPIKQYQLELEAEIKELRLADGKKKLTSLSRKK